MRVLSGSLLLLACGFLVSSATESDVTSLIQVAPELNVAPAAVGEGLASLADRWKRADADVDRGLFSAELAPAPSPEGAEYVDLAAITAWANKGKDRRARNEAKKSAVAEMKKQPLEPITKPSMTRSLFDKVGSKVKDMKHQATERFRSNAEDKEMLAKTKKEREAQYRADRAAADAKEEGPGDRMMAGSGSRGTADSSASAFSEAASDVWMESKSASMSAAQAKRVSWAEQANRQAGRNKRQETELSAKQCDTFKCHAEEGSFLLPNATNVECVEGRCTNRKCCVQVPPLPDFEKYAGYFMPKGHEVSLEELSFDSPAVDPDFQEAQFINIDLAKYECYLSKTCVGFCHRGEAPEKGTSTWVYFKTSPNIGKLPQPKKKCPEVMMEKMETVTCVEDPAPETWTSYLMPVSLERAGR